MQVMIEFYRIRQADNAHAVVGRETVEAADLPEALSIARRLWRTLDMPQCPDGVSLCDREGNPFFSGALDATGIPEQAAD